MILNYLKHENEKRNYIINTLFNTNYYYNNKIYNLLITK